LLASQQTTSFEKLMNILSWSHTQEQTNQ